MFASAFFHRHHVVERLVRFHLRHHCPHGGDQTGRLAGDADDEAHRVSHVFQVRAIHLRHNVSRQPALPHIADNPHHGLPARLCRTWMQADSFADRAFAGEEMFLKGLVDDYRSRRRTRILRSERPSVLHGNTHRVEVIAGDRRPGNRRHLAPLRLAEVDWWPALDFRHADARKSVSGRESVAAAACTPGSAFNRSTICSTKLTI